MPHKAVRGFLTMLTPNHHVDGKHLAGDLVVRQELILGNQLKLPKAKQEKLEGFRIFGEVSQLLTNLRLFCLVLEIIAFN